MLHWRGMRLRKGKSPARVSQGRAPCAEFPLQWAKRHDAPGLLGLAKLPFHSNKARRPRLGIHSPKVSCLPWVLQPQALGTYLAVQLSPAPCTAMTGHCMGGALLPFIWIHPCYKFQRPTGQLKPQGKEPPVMVILGAGPLSTLAGFHSSPWAFAGGLSTNLCLSCAPGRLVRSAASPGFHSTPPLDRVEMQELLGHGTLKGCTEQRGPRPTVTRGDLRSVRTVQ